MGNLRGIRMSLNSNISFSHILSNFVWILISLSVYSSNCDSSPPSPSDKKISVNSTEKANKEPESVLRLIKFKHQSCDGTMDNHLLQIEDLSLSSNMTSRSAQVFFSFTGELLSDIDSPVEADLHVSFKVGALWFPVPCVRQRGSCHYDDVCGMASQYSCPQELQDQGLTCQCPMKKGKVSVSGMSFDLPSSSKSGAFIVVANVTQGNDIVMCQEMFARFKSFKLDNDDEDEIKSKGYFNV